MTSHASPSARGGHGRVAVAPCGDCFEGGVELGPLGGERVLDPQWEARGLSSDNPNHSWDRIVEDVLAFAESIGEPVGMVGHSSGGALALEAASRTEAVSALALFEPTVFGIGADHERDAQRDERGYGRIHQLADEGRFVDAVRVFVEEIAVAEQPHCEMFVKGAVAHSCHLPSRAALQ